MSHEEYVAYLRHEAEKKIQLEADRYKNWLQFIAQSSPKESSVGKQIAESGRSGQEGDPVVAIDRRQSAPNTKDSFNLAAKAQEIRSFVRANVNDKEHKHMTKSARNALLSLVRVSSERLLENIPNDALIAWYENWVGKVKT